MKFFSPLIFFTLVGWLLLLQSVQGQWVDDFSEFSSEWTGDTGCFEVDSGYLRSAGPPRASRIGLSRVFGPSAVGADRGSPSDSSAWSGSSPLSDRDFFQGVMTGDSALCFELSADLDFVPSSTNLLRWYLVSDRPGLSDTASAYYLSLGSKESRNYWQLYRSDPDTVVCLWQGKHGFSKMRTMRFRVRAVYRTCDTLGEATPEDNSLGIWPRPGYLSFYVSVWEEDGFSEWEPDGDSLFCQLLGHVLKRPSDRFYSGLLLIYRTVSRAGQYAFDRMQAHRIPVEPDEAPASDSLPQDGIDGPPPVRRPGPASVIINEILADPASGQSRFVELYNRDDTAFALLPLALGIPLESDAASLSGNGGLRAGFPSEEGKTDWNAWKFYRLTADSSCWIQPGSCMAVAKDAGKLGVSARICPENVFTARSFPVLEEDGIIGLFWLPPASDSLSDTLLLDEVFYTKDAHHWLLDDTEGVSLERLDPDMPALTAEAWMSAAETSGFATPGCENSHRRSEDMPPEEDYFWMEPQVVTPNNDGYNDYARICWNPQLSGCFCSITVYDAQGRKMKQICQSRLLGASGYIRYDAVDADQRVLRPGIYLLWIELLRPDGKRKRLRYPWVVG